VLLPTIEISLIGPIRPMNGLVMCWETAINSDSDEAGFIPPYGNYQELLSYQKAEVVYDITFRFCQRFLQRGDRTIDQMVQAARSGKQNILEGSLERNGDQAYKRGASQLGGVAGRLSRLPARARSAAMG
jgi:hypothetical protein